MAITQRFSDAKKRVLVSIKNCIYQIKIQYHDCSVFGLSKTVGSWNGYLHYVHNINEGFLKIYTVVDREKIHNLCYLNH